MNNKKIILSLLIITVTLISLYATVYLPLRKNQLIFKANDIRNQSINEVLSNFRYGLEYKSLIGQEEIDGTLFKFSAELLDFLHNQQSPLLKNIGFINQIITFNQEWFEKNHTKYVSVKNLYYFTQLMSRTYNITGDKKYLNKTKELTDIGSKIAPSRIEFIQMKYVIAKIEHNEEEAKKINALLHQLRLDLTFELNDNPTGSEKN